MTPTQDLLQLDLSINQLPVPLIAKPIYVDQLKKLGSTNTSWPSYFRRRPWHSASSTNGAFIPSGAKLREFGLLSATLAPKVLHASLHFRASTRIYHISYRLPSGKLSLSKTCFRLGMSLHIDLFAFLYRSPVISHKSDHTAMLCSSQIEGTKKAQSSYLVRGWWYSPAWSSVVELPKNRAPSPRNDAHKPWIDEHHYHEFPFIGLDCGFDKIDGSSNLYRLMSFELESLPITPTTHIIDLQSPSGIEHAATEKSPCAATPEDYGIHWQDTQGSEYPTLIMLGRGRVIPHPSLDISGLVPSQPWSLFVCMIHSQVLQRMNDFPVYIASFVLNPKLKWKFFETRLENEYDRVLRSWHSLQDF